jgi:cytochrome c-type biogenesis protein CcmF
MAAMVLTGTLYPLLIDALDAGKISVGPPYFGLLFNWLLVPMVLALHFGIFSRWQQDDASRLAGKLKWPLLISIVVGAGVWIMQPAMGWLSTTGVIAGMWVIMGSLFLLGQLMKKSNGFKPPAGVMSMTLAHVGLGVFLIGLSMSSSLSGEKHLRMEAGDKYETAGHVFEFTGTKMVQGPNYKADEGEFIVTKGGKEVARLYPQKREYSQRGSMMTEAAIDPGFTRDLYVSLGEPLDSMGRAWAVRVYYKPFIRWIWLGAIFMALGGLVAAGNKRYRRNATVGETVNKGTQEVPA